MKEFKTVVITTLLWSICWNLSADDNSSFSIAAVADVQYADTKPRGDRQPGEGVARLTHAVSQWNQRELDWAVMLGDVIDWDDIDYSKFPKQTVATGQPKWQHTKAVLSAWKKLDCKKYMVLGNHDYYVPDTDADGVTKPASVFRAYGFTDKAYYSFAHKGFRFIVLDGDLCPHNYAEGTDEHRKASDYYNSVSGPQKRWWNAGITDTQLDWLKSVFKKSLEDKERVVIMCHYPTHKPLDGHSLLNSEALLPILDDYPNIALWLNGHNHLGDYTKVGERHHLTLKGMQNGGSHWYQLTFSSTDIKVYQAEDTKTPKHILMLPKF